MHPSAYQYASYLTFSIYILIPLDLRHMYVQVDNMDCHVLHHVELSVHPSISKI